MSDLQRYKEKFQEGWDAYNKGTRNPYVEGCIDSEAWKEGYYECQMCHVRSRPRGIEAAFIKDENE
jgi:hypothetical protein